MNLLISSENKNYCSVNGCPIFDYWETVNLIIRNNIIREGIYKFQRSVTLNVPSRNAQWFLMQKWLISSLAKDISREIIDKFQPWVTLTFWSKNNQHFCYLVFVVVLTYSSLYNTEICSLPLANFLFPLPLLYTAFFQRVGVHVSSSWPKIMNITHTPWNCRKWRFGRRDPLGAWYHVSVNIYRCNTRAVLWSHT